MARSTISQFDANDFGVKEDTQRERERESARRRSEGGGMERGHNFNDDKLTGLFAIVFFFFVFK